MSLFSLRLLHWSSAPHCQTHRLIRWPIHVTGQFGKFHCQPWYPRVMSEVWKDSLSLTTETGGKQAKVGRNSIQIKIEWFLEFDDRLTDYFPFTSMIRNSGFLSHVGNLPSSNANTCISDVDQHSKIFGLFRAVGFSVGLGQMSRWQRDFGRALINFHIEGCLRQWLIQCCSEQNPGLHGTSSVAHPSFQHDKNIFAANLHISDKCRKA